MRRRYAVVFTPVGWHIVDTRTARDPVAQYGTGRDEYARAKQEARRLNETHEGEPYGNDRG
jgi:hypothetical protein